MKKSLKIFIVTTTFFPNVGGAEYQVKFLSEELAKRGHEVYLFVPHYEEKYINQNKFLKIINIGINKDTNNITKFLKILYTFIKWVVKVHPDIIHAHYAFWAGFLAVITKPIHRAPVIITSHGEDIQIDRESNYGMRLNKVKNILIRYTLKKCDVHVIVSSLMREDAKDAGSECEKIKVIYNMFVPPTVEFSEEDIKKIRIKYGIPLNGKIVLSVSRLHPKKGLNYLIEAMECIVKDHPNVFLVIAGKGPERDRLESMVKSKKMDKRVIFTGFVSEYEKLLLIKSCDIFCLPSIKEGLPIALFDPMYFSKPIVATNVEGVQEILDHTGLIVKKGDSKELAKAIVRLLSCSVGKLRNIGKKEKLRLDKFSLKRIVDKYERLYFSLVYG